MKQTVIRKRTVHFLLKLIRMVTLLVAICFLSFIMVKKSPIDPVQAYVQSDLMSVGTEQREKIAEYWGLDQPIFIQFRQWFLSLLKGNLGTSMVYRQPVAKVISERFFNSIILMTAAWVISGFFGFLLGSVAAIKKGTWVDKIIVTFSYLLASTPPFWMGLLCLMLFSVTLGWFPLGLSVPVGVLSENVTWADKLSHLVLPAATLGLLGVANIALHTRQKLIDVLESDYVLFGKARGETAHQTYWRHGFRNILLPAITLQFAAFSELFGGAILAEQVFSYPGLGQATVQAGLSGDAPLLLGIVIFSAIFVFVGNMLADMIYYIVDPRTRVL